MAENQAYRMNLKTTLDSIANERRHWEEGTLKAANGELYAILERCYKIYADLKDDTAKRRILNALLVDLGMKPKTSTGLALKVIRYVFGKEGSREQAYARVITIIYELKPADQGFVSYIEERGGIEEIRRENRIKSTTAMTPDDYRKLAIEALRVASVPVASFKLPSFIQPNKDYDEDYVVGLIRCNTDGTGDLVFGNSDARVIDVVLAASGRDLDQKAQDSIKELEHGDIAKRRAADVAAFAPRLFSQVKGSTVVERAAIPAE
jgi:hypothetical protein